jgi:multidrug efflux pump subunit AcrB
MAVVFAMLASYGLSRTIVPLMSKHLLAHEHEGPEKEGPEKEGPEKEESPEVPNQEARFLPLNLSSN